MAESPQHPLQIMEHQTRFDLNVALENWRGELAAQTHLTPDDRRELETHLRDSFAGLKTQGLNEEESFWLARRRVGRPQQLAEEFIKADPAKVWRERVFWMALALLFYSLSSCLAVTLTAVIMSFIHSWLSNHGLNPVGNCLLFITMAFHLLPLCVIGFVLSKKHGGRHSRFITFFYSRKIIVGLAGLIIGLSGCEIFPLFFDKPGHLNSPEVWFRLVSTVIWPLALTFFIARLMPTQKRQALKIA
jgi:hypothetical protein